MNTIYDKLIEYIPNFTRFDTSKLSVLQKKNVKKIYNSLQNNAPYDKKTIRKEYKNIRDCLQESDRKKYSKIITNKLFQLDQYKNAKTIFCFISFSSEFDTSEIISDALKKGKRVCVPLTEQNHIMLANEIDNQTEYVLDKYGIKEPTTRKIIKKEEIDLIVVPGLVFDYLGFRVGYGGGYYDRFLSDFKGFSVGVCFDDCISDEIIPDEYDIPVNLVLSN